MILQLMIQGRLMLSSCCYSNNKYPFLQAKKVQSDLQVYVKSKRIDTLVGNLLEAVIKDRPDIHIAYILNYVYEKYYDDTKCAFEEFAKSYESTRYAIDSTNTRRFLM